MKFYLFVLIAVLAVSGCSNQTETENDGNPAASPTTETASPEPASDEKVYATPKDALAAFVAAVKAKDENVVKSALSDKTNKMFELQAKVSGKDMLDLFDSEAFENISKMPEVRGEKVEGDKATLEAKDPDEDKWDKMSFVKENGSWKIALLDAEYDKDYENMVKAAEKMPKAEKVSPNTGKPESEGASETKKSDN